MDLKELELGVDPKTHWYYQSKKQPLIRYVKKIAAQLQTKLTLIDVGSGSGFFMYELMDEVPHLIEKVWLVDIGYTDAEIETTKNQIIEKIRVLPENISNGLFVMMDVLEHLKDDAAMLNDIKQSSMGTNYYFITVPAFMSLWSGHDVYLEHYRRYTASGLRRLLHSSNFSISNCYYIYNTIFPLVWLFRKLGNKTYQPKSSMKPENTLVNSILLAFHKAENGIGKWNKWFGVTCVAEGSFRSSD